MNVNININKKIALIVAGVVVLLALVAGVSLAVTAAQNNHNLAVQRAAAAAVHKRDVIAHTKAAAAAKAKATAQAIARANARAAKAEKSAKKAARAAKAAANKPAPPAAVVVPGAPAAPAQPAGTLDGCPTGDVCMYTLAGWQSQQPEHEYFDYGTYNLSGEVGSRLVVNNQTGGATITGYTHYGGTGWAWTLPAQQENEYDVTPINSISLNS